MLLGNKCDMADKRMVSKERGEQIAREHSIRFLETSAKANVNIDKAFYDLAESILSKVRLKNLLGKKFATYLCRFRYQIKIPFRHRQGLIWIKKRKKHHQDVASKKLIRVS